MHRQIKMTDWLKPILVPCHRHHMGTRPDCNRVHRVCRPLAQTIADSDSPESHVCLGQPWWKHLWVQCIHGYSVKEHPLSPSRGANWTDSDHSFGVSREVLSKDDMHRCWVGLWRKALGFLVNFSSQCQQSSISRQFSIGSSQLSGIQRKAMWGDCENRYQEPTAHKFGQKCCPMSRVVDEITSWIDQFEDRKLWIPLGWTPTWAWLVHRNPSFPHLNRVVSFLTLWCNICFGSLSKPRTVDGWHLLHHNNRDVSRMGKVHRVDTKISLYPHRDNCAEWQKKRNDGSVPGNGYTCNWCFECWNHCNLIISGFPRTGAPPVQNFPKLEELEHGLFGDG